MHYKLKKKLFFTVLSSAVLICTVFTFNRVRFLTGGAFLNIGYFFQDGVELGISEEHSPRMILEQVLKYNKLSSLMRRIFPRSKHHPVVALVSCMDGRLHTDELVGDSRSYYYVVRTAGSIIEPPEIEMLELAVSNGVKVILFTTHSDCAAEKVANDPKQSLVFPNLSQAVNRREQRFQEFLNRPLISEKIASGELLVKRVTVDTLAGASFH